MFWRYLLAVGAVFTLAAPLGCYSLTPHTDGDADADADGDVERCQEALECEAAGLAEDYPISIVAEVVEVDDDEAVLIGTDGLPLTYDACGLALAGALPIGLGVEVFHYEPEGWADCWVTILAGEGGPIAAVSRCEAEGAVAPPLDELGWEARLEPSCEGFVASVCSTPDGPVPLEVPVTVFDVEFTTDTMARMRVGPGERAGAADWMVSVIAASATEAVDEDDCFVPAAGSSLVSLVRQTGRVPCPEVPEVDRSALGLSVAAAETVRELRVIEVSEDLVVLASDEGVEVTFGWYGPDPRRTLSEGETVVARRYPRDVTGAGALDVLEAGGVPVLAATYGDPFVLEVPDLSAIGLDVEVGEPCVYEEGASPCSGESLYADRYPLIVTNEGGASVEIEVGETEMVGAQLVTLLEASQHPAVVCPDLHVEAWGPFGITVMLEYL